MIKPLTFLTLLRDSDENIKNIYSYGACYQLGKLLSTMYPQASLYKVKDDNKYVHVITKIDGEFYDIGGFANQDDINNSEPVVNEDLEWLEKWSFSKDYKLTKSCEFCGEYVFIDM